MVPMMQGRMPPAVMESRGISVKKLQEMAGSPLMSRKAQMMANAARLMSEDKPKMPHMNFWVRWRRANLPLATALGCITTLLGAYRVAAPTCLCFSATWLATRLKARVNRNNTMPMAKRAR